MGKGGGGGGTTGLQRWCRDFLPWKKLNSAAQYLIANS